VGAAPRVPYAKYVVGEKSAAPTVLVADAIDIPALLGLAHVWRAALRASTKGKVLGLSFLVLL
jgi:hypothetical protein